MVRDLARPDQIGLARSEPGQTLRHILARSDLTGQDLARSESDLARTARAVGIELTRDACAHTPAACDLSAGRALRALWHSNRMLQAVLACSCVRAGGSGVEAQPRYPRNKRASRVYPGASDSLRASRATFERFRESCAQFGKTEGKYPLRSLTLASRSRASLARMNDSELLNLIF